LSVAGNLQDLSLTELLQTISLSRKSGVLEICSEDEVAWLGLREGGIVRVALSDQNMTRSLALKDAGLDDSSPSDAIEACLWDAAVSAILTLFEWHDGEFTFNTEEDPNEIWRGPEGLVLPTSLSPEFLALEGARLEDESDEPEGDVMFGFECETPAPEPDKEPDGDSRAVAPPPLLVTPDHPESEVEQIPEQEPPAPEPDPQPASLASPPAPVIAVAGELALLEFIKAGLAPGEMPVHIFQEARLAFERLKQYLVRGTVPTLVIGIDVSDPDEREGRWDQLATRVRRMAPAARLVLLSPDKNATSDLVDAIVVTCDPTQASDHQKREFLYTLATSLREDA
jgi:hypothetical protein